MDDLIETVLNMKLLWLREMIEKDTQLWIEIQGLFHHGIEYGEIVQKMIRIDTIINGEIIMGLARLQREHDIIRQWLFQMN